MSVWQAFAETKISIKKGQSLPFPFFVISACNPLAVKLSWSDNQALHFALRRYLLSGFPRALLMEVVGHSAENQWEEPSWAIYGIDELQALAVGRLFWQLAIFRFDLKGRQLLSCGNHAARDLLDNGKGTC